MVATHLCPVSLTGLDPIVTFGIGGRLVKTQDSDPSYQAGPACQVITAIMALEVRRDGDFSAGIPPHLSYCALQST